MSPTKSEAQENTNYSLSKLNLSDPILNRLKPSGQKPLKGLAIVATPIGNSRDITLRALDILEQADTIACEDTRITAKLLSIYGISRPLIAYHEHNAENVRPKIINLLKKGKTVALVSDAGTPLISDPGFKLVRACTDEEIPITPIPGASSVLASLMTSAMPTDQFFFAGFLAPKTIARKKYLKSLINIRTTIVIMESARRLAGSLRDMADILGPRNAVVARELTKLYEELKHGSLTDLALYYDIEGAPKGEIIIVIGPPKKEVINDENLDALILTALKDNSVRDAANSITASSGLPRRKIYARALALKKIKK
jgi:16S rRNA (cytidine1402-2'-O)-methyltransferase